MITGSSSEKRQFLDYISDSNNDEWMVDYFQIPSYNYDVFFADVLKKAGYGSIYRFLKDRKESGLPTVVADIMGSGVISYEESIGAVVDEIFVFRLTGSPAVLAQKALEYERRGLLMRGVANKLPSLYKFASNGKIRFVLKNVFDVDFIKEGENALKDWKSGNRRKFDLIIIRPYGPLSFSITREAMSKKQVDMYKAIIIQYFKAVLRSMSNGGLALVQIPRVIDSEVDNFINELNIDHNRYQIFSNTDNPFIDEHDCKIYSILVKNLDI